MFEPEVYRKLMYCIEEITCDVFGIFGAPALIQRPHSDTGEGELCPLAPIVTPLLVMEKLRITGIRIRKNYNKTSFERLNPCSAY